MFETVAIPILGIIENMSYFIAPDTGNRYNIFGEGGGANSPTRIMSLSWVQFPSEWKLEKVATRVCRLLSAIRIRHRRWRLDV